MRHKNPPAPPKDAIPLTPTEPTDAEVSIQSIVTLTAVLRRALHPEYGVTPEQLGDLCEMYVALMHMKRVTDRWFTEHIMRATKMIGLAKQIEAEAKLSRLDLPKETQDTIMAAIELSMKEINSLREKLLEDVELLAQIPLPGTKIH